VKTLLRGLIVNHAKLHADADDVGLHPVHTDRTPQEMADIVQRWAGQARHWKLVERSTQSRNTSDPIRLHLTRTTAVFRFTDDIHVRIGPMTGESSETTILDADSQSRIGKGDLGQNARNLKELTRGISELLGEAAPSA